MHLNRRIKIQLAVFAVIAVVAAAILALQFAKIPAMVGIGRYTVTVELPRSGGLYDAANVTYRGVQVGKVESVGLTESGTVRAVLSLKSGIDIPSNLRAEVHSQSAIGEQYLALLPNDATSAPLSNGDAIAMKNTIDPPGYRQDSGCHRPRPPSHTAGQSQDGGRRKLHGDRRTGP